jgi:hypothetical protein
VVGGASLAGGSKNLQMAQTHVSVLKIKEKLGHLLVLVYSVEKLGHLLVWDIESYKLCIRSFNIYSLKKIQKMAQGILHFLGYLKSLFV